jgi:hypothetical protein
MANNLGSNITNKVARVFLKEFESSRVLTKTIDTQLFAGAFTPQFGDTIAVKRPHDYRAIRTAGGDISLETKSPIIAGKANATVQNYITVATEWTNKEEALDLDQLTEILKPCATRAVTELETSLGTFMRTRMGGAYGTPGTAVDTWEEVAGAGAYLQTIGVPMDAPWYYVMNPFVNMKLASAQSGLYAADKLVTTAWERAQISKNFGGLTGISSNALGAFTNGVCADRAGTIVGTPTATYVAAKDTMTQSVAIAGMTAGGVIKAGEVVQVTGKYRLNLSTRQQVVDAAGDPILWRAVVTQDVTLDSSGEGTLILTGPAIYESTGAYNTIDAALGNGNVITVLGASADTVAPNLVYHKQAFTMATVKLPKLHTWDTVATTSDGISIRVTKYSDGDANTQQIRFDLLPAFGVMNPFFGLLGYGV